MRVLEHLKDEMRRLGVTQLHIEARTGIPQSEVGKILRGGRKKPSLDALHALAQCVGRSLADLLQDDLPPTEWSDDVLQTALALESLPADNPTRGAVLKVAMMAAKGRHPRKTPPSR